VSTGQVECVRYDNELIKLGLSRFNTNKTSSRFLSEKILKKQKEEEVIKQREAEKEIFRQNQIFQEYLERHGIQVTSILKDFYSGRY